MARRHPVAGELLAAFHGADAEARQVVVAGGIHSWHFRGLAADQRAAGDAAPLGYPGDDPFGDCVVQLRAGEVIEEEQRLGALHNEIVGTHCDQVDAHPVVPSGLDR